MNPHERNETYTMPPSMRAPALRLLAVQAAIGAGLAVVVSLSGLPWGPWLPAVALVGGSWTWASREGRRRPELLTLLGVRALARHVAPPLGAAAAGVYITFALARPDQLPLPLPVLLLTGLLLGGVGGVTGGMLTLCGLDLGRPPTASTGRRQPRARTGQDPPAR